MSSPTSSAISRHSENLFSPAFWTGNVDPRPLGVFRICFGLLLLKDSLYRVPLAAEYYSDAGLLPRSVLLATPLPAYRFCLMDALGPAPLVVLFFLFQAAVAVALALGYRTRLASVLSWVMLVSVQYRNGLFLTGADAVFRLLAFWGMFIPLGERYSLDSLRRRLGQRGVAPASREAWALPVRMAQLQIAIVYLATAEIKLRYGEWWNGDALFYTRQAESLLLPWTPWLLQGVPHDALLLAARAIVLLEWGLPFLLLSPAGQPLARRVGLVGGLLLHGAIAVTMVIRDFSLLMLSSYWLFVDTGWMDAVADRLTRSRDPRTAPVSRRSPWRPWVLAARGVEPAATTGADPPSTLTLATPAGETLRGDDAFRDLADHLAPSALWRRVLGSPRLRVQALRLSGWIVRRTPRRRLRTGGWRSRLAPLGRVATATALVVVMASVAWWNVTVTYSPMAPLPPRPAVRVVLYGVLTQTWNMFSSGGRRPDAWIELRGWHADGSAVDLERGGPPREELPRRFAGPWLRRTALERVATEIPDEVRAAWAARHCRLAAGTKAPVVAVELVYHWREPHAPGAPIRPLHSRVLWRETCAGSPASPTPLRTAPKAGESG